MICDGETLPQVPSNFVIVSDEKCTEDIGETIRETIKWAVKTFGYVLLPPIFLLLLITATRWVISGFKNTQ